MKSGEMRVVVVSDEEDLELCVTGRRCEGANSMVSPNMEMKKGKKTFRFEGGDQKSDCTRIRLSIESRANSMPHGWLSLQVQMQVRSHSIKCAIDVVGISI